MPDDKDRAQAALKECGIEAGQKYIHYKGGSYKVVAVSLKEDTLERMVTYYSLEKDSYWTRTLTDFTEQVILPDDSTRPRFDRETD